jgi:hypothetical protein
MGYFQFLGQYLYRSSVGLELCLVYLLSSSPLVDLSLRSPLDTHDCLFLGAEEINI